MRYISSVNKSKTRWQKLSSPFFVALVFSLLLHQLFMVIMGEFWNPPELETKKEQKIVLVDPPPPPDSKVAPKPKTEKKPEIKSKARARRSKPEPMRNQTVPHQHEQVAKAPPVPLTGPPVPLQGPPAPEVASPQSRQQLAKRKLKLDLDWRTFERTFAEQALEEREAYAQTRLAARQGRGGFGQLSGKVRRALTNNRGWIRPGNQEPLGPRKQLFHNYIELIHETHIHPIFGESFWESLSSFATDHPLNNMNMYTVAEFEIFANGNVSEVRVVKSSGNAVFDAAAVDSIYRSSPFPAPPKAVLSWNERVYLRWGFYRSQRMCGVFNVEPYILRAPDAEKEQISVDEFTDESG